MKKPRNPEGVVAEILGQRTEAGTHENLGDFLCPYMGKRCIKRSTSNKAEPYPVCSIWLGSDEEGKRTPNKHLFCVCPKRFYELEFLNDVVNHCWWAGGPRNPVVAREVKMKGFGNVDFVIADQGENGLISQFLSVELQAIDITGTVYPDYKALRTGNYVEPPKNYGLNWDNVYKRYITQLIRKGYFHHHWKSKIVAVIQDQVYNNIIHRANFLRSSDIQDPTVNIIFMSYVFESNKAKAGQYIPKLKTVEGTSHSNLQQAALYMDAPGREDFCQQIVKSLNRKVPKSSSKKSAIS